jgi:uncharacterized protein (DUF952 family)
MDTARDEDPIYHLAVEDALRAAVSEDAYRPADLGATGFVHCALEASVLAVADDYFADARGRLVVLEIDPGRLAAETRYEAPAPLPGAGEAHLRSAPVFPHVYGPIDRAAIHRVGVLRRTATGHAWPERFESLDAFLARGG